MNTTPLLLALILFVVWRIAPYHALHRRRIARRGYRQRAYYAGRHQHITLDRLYARDHGICGICHHPVERYEASIDHIHPLARGGAHTWRNVQLAHRRCNSRKGTKMYCR